MASMTMTASSLGGTAAMQVPAATQRGALVVRALREPEKVVEESSKGRRELMFGVVAAAAYTVAKVSMATEPKRGSPDAKKEYAPVCVTNPTARICRY
ncbi:hypothetical protein ACS0TY_005377 [Phlomoides rotata]